MLTLLILYLPSLLLTAILGYRLRIHLIRLFNPFRVLFRLCLHVIQVTVRIIKNEIKLIYGVIWMHIQFQALTYLDVYNIMPRNCYWFETFLYEQTWAWVVYLITLQPYVIVKPIDSRMILSQMPYPYQETEGDMSQIDSISLHHAKVEIEKERKAEHIKMNAIKKYKPFEPKLVEPLKWWVSDERVVTSRHCDIMVGANLCSEQIIHLTTGKVSQVKVDKSMLNAAKLRFSVFDHRSIDVMQFQSRITQVNLPADECAEVIAGSCVIYQDWAAREYRRLNHLIH